MVDGRPILLVQPDVLGQPQRDPARAQHVLHRLPQAEVDRQRERGDEVREPDLLPAA